MYNNDRQNNKNKKICIKTKGKRRKTVENRRTTVEKRRKTVENRRKCLLLCLFLGLRSSQNLPPGPGNRKGRGRRACRGPPRPHPRGLAQQDGAARPGKRHNDRPVMPILYGFCNCVYGFCNFLYGFCHLLYGFCNF